MHKYKYFSAAVSFLIILIFALQPAAYADQGITDIYFAGIKNPPLNTLLDCGSGTALIRRDGDGVVIELNNAEITSGSVINSLDGFAAIKSNEDITLILSGSNIIRAEGHRFTYGIVSDSSGLVIKGGGSLKVISSCAFLNDQNLSASFGISTKGVTIEDCAVEVFADSRPAQAAGKEAYAVALDSKTGDLIIRENASVTATARSDTYYAKAVGCLKAFELQGGSLEAYSESSYNSANNSALFMDTGSRLRLCGGCLYLKGENRAATIRSSDIMGGQLLGSDSAQGEVQSPLTHDPAGGSFTIGGKRALQIRSAYSPVKVNFEPNGGVSAKTFDYVTPGNKYGSVLPSVSRAGFDFDGWYTGPENGVKVEPSSFVSACGDFTLYAHWSGNVIITFDAQGGDCEQKTLTIPIGSACGELPEPILTGHTFAGWYTSDGTIITADHEFIESCTLYACYVPKRYTVTFDAQGGALTEKTRDVSYGDCLSDLPEPTKMGYVFDGWYDPEGTKITLDHKFTESLTLYARYDPERYTVTFDACGGTVSEKSRTVTFGSTAGELPVPKREGWSFTGWYDPGGTKITYGYTFTKSITAFAHWEKEKPIVTGVYVPDMDLVFRKLYKIEYTVSATGETDVKTRFASSDESIVNVSGAGLIRGVKTGEADITVTAEDEWGNTVRTQFHVTVRYAWWQWLIRIFLLGFIWYG